MNFIIGFIATLVTSSVVRVVVARILVALGVSVLTYTGVGVAMSAAFTAAKSRVRDRRERVAGIPASAPVYDPQQKVKSQPRPEGCMQMNVGAAVHRECTGPNRQVLQLTVTECMELVKRGWFDETRQYPDVRQQNVEALNRRSVTSAGAVESAKPAG